MGGWSMVTMNKMKKSYAWFLFLKIVLWFIFDMSLMFCRILPTDHRSNQHAADPSCHHHPPTNNRSSQHEWTHGCHYHPPTDHKSSQYAADPGCNHHPSTNNKSSQHEWTLAATIIHQLNKETFKWWMNDCFYKTVCEFCLSPKRCVNFFYLELCLWIFTKI